MIQIIKEILNVPKEIDKLCKTLDCEVQKTVHSVKTNGVALEKIKKKP